MQEMAPEPLASWEDPTTEATDTVSTQSGIRALMLAVLEDAIKNLTSSARALRAEAERWMMNRERRDVFSFAVVCETLDLEPAAVRRSIMRLLVNKPTRGRLLMRNRPNVRHGGAIHLQAPRSRKRRRQKLRSAGADCSAASTRKTAV